MSRTPRAGKVRITDRDGDLVAEFTDQPAETSEKLVSFWQAWLSEEPVTIERGRVTAQMPERWSSVPAAVEAWQALSEHGISARPQERELEAG
jgi:hypothetical protein